MGQAGGEWGIVEGFIQDEVCSGGVRVTVYDPPGATFLGLTRPPKEATPERPRPDRANEELKLDFLA
jgi:hypothetical protein